MEKFDYESMKDHFIRKTEKVHRMRCKQVKIFGLWFFKKLTDQEWAEKKKFFVTRNDTIKSQDELVDYMVKLQ